MRLRTPTDEEASRWAKELITSMVEIVSSKKFIYYSLGALVVLYALSYQWVFRAMSGYFDQTEWAVHGVLTNWTFGFALFWPGMGFCIALLIRQYGQRKGLSQEKIRSLIVFCVALIMMVFAYLFSMMGLEGFRF